MIEYKNYNIIHDPRLNMKFIKIIGKGSVPLELRGYFTSAPIAIRAIDGWLKKKGVSNGEAGSTS
jgi:hypothetical protein